MGETLDAALRDSEALLAEGAGNLGSIWRNPTLITVGEGLIPQARTVVLRRFDGLERVIETHTDTRSAKHRELLAQSSASLHGWDGERKIQLRLTGRATLHTEDAVAETAWAALRPQSRATYLVQPGPGTVIAEPDQTFQGSEAEARAAFCVIRLVYDTLEYLHLASAGNQRARFTWLARAPIAEWLAP